MGDYFAHWLAIGRREGAVLPRVFQVNWFRKDPEGRFIWPGFGENARVLAWVFDRCNDKGETVETPIGLVPAADGIPTDGLDLSDAELQELLTVDEGKLRSEIAQVKEHLAMFGDRLPEEITGQLRKLEERLG
jgi:phosphoenolpyruvate carboxykinase (GTP)